MGGHLVTLTQLFSPCLLGHADDPLRTRHDGVLHWECRRCGQLLQPVLSTTPAAKRRRRKPPTPVLRFVPTKEACR